MDQTYNYRDKKYRDDTVFQLINKKYLTLQEEEKKANNEHLKAVIEQKFIPLMKEDELFALMYKRIMYGGSYYKGTKYGKPEEFDLDFIIKLPINYSKITVDANHNNYGYVKIKIDTDGPMHPHWVKHNRVLSKWLTYDNYLDQDKFRAWMERIFTKAFEKLHRSGNCYIMQLHGKTYTITHRKSGPAFTMIIITPEGSKIDVDLVPALEFGDVSLNNGYRSLNGNRKSWMIVAKPLNSCPDHNVLWRLCFYESEKEMLEGNLKPVIRMMKKFRDTVGWKSIASYYIETIFYHELQNHSYDLYNFLNAPKTHLFILGLRRLKDALEANNLPYFWHPDHNLFGRINSSELYGYFRYLQRILTIIYKKIENDKFILADVVLGPTEGNKLRMAHLTNGVSDLNISESTVPEQPAAETGSWCILM